MWQDYVFAVGSAIFAVALLPSVMGKNKPAKSTCALTGGVLAVFALNYLTLSLWYAATTTAITAVLWLTMLVQQLGSEMYEKE